MADENLGLIKPETDDAPVSDKQQSIIDSIAHRVKQAVGTEVPSSADPGVYYADDEQDFQARALTEHYQARRSAEEGTFANDLVPAPSVPAPTGLDYAKNAANFLFGDTAAAFGVTLKQDGLHASLDTMRDMWSDHPWRAGMAVAADAGPAFAGAYRMARVLRGAGAGIDASELVIKGLVNSVEDYAKYTPEAKAIVQGQAKKIADLTALRSAVDSGTATPIQKGKLWFHESFGNSYLESQTLTDTNPDAALKMWHQKIGDIVSGQQVNGLLDMADDIKATEGSAILHAIKDPSQLGNLSAKSREFAVAYSAEGREMQKQALAEGFIDQETVDKVGDVWFSTVRKDSPIFEESATTKNISVIRKKTAEPGKTGDLRIINIPRTSSPNLMQRTAGQADVLDLIKRQRASEALDSGLNDKALKLLSGTKDEEAATSLINSGQKSEAQKLLNKDGQLHTDPKDLVVKSLIQQKLLLENFRTLRDVALNPSITKSAEEVAAMSAGTKRRMISLDSVVNAGTLRRMVAIKKGVPAVNELGYIDQSLFKEIAQVAHPASANQYASILQFATAMLKTAKTALNPFTHMQNMVGNTVFLWNAGMGLPEQYNLGKKSWQALSSYQAARKSGLGMEALKDLGSIKSLVKGSPDINIAEEMSHPLLTGMHGLLDTSSMEASEGIPIMNRLYAQAGDHQVLLKKMIEYTQAASKKINVGGITAEKMSAWYQAEDSAAKFSYFLHLRQQGLNPLAASNEVAKRLPMYGTSGLSIQGLRKAALPWLSFPTETIRIMKNNMIDHPFRTAMVMNSPNILQTGVAAAGNMSYEQANSLKEQNPMWAQSSSGVVAPSMLTNPFQNQANKGQVRTFMLTMLPHFSILPQSEAADAGWQEKLPMNTGQLFPIIQGFTDALTGKGQFGQDIVTDPDSSTSKMSAILMRTIGTIAPPVLQKYLLNPELPTSYYRLGIDAGKYTNPSTGETGSPFFDLLENNALMKSYGGSPEMQISNSRYGDRRLADFRGRLGRELRAWTETGDWQNVGNTLRSVKSTFDKENPDNPAFAHRKYMDWVKLHSRDVMKNPAFKGISKQEFQQKLTEEADSQTKNMNPARQAYIDALRKGFQESGGQRKPGNKGNPLYTSVYSK